MPSRKSAIIALITVSALWGIAGVTIKYTLDYIPPITFLYIRFLIAAIILYFFVQTELKKLLHNKNIFAAVINKFTSKSQNSKVKTQVKNVKEEIENLNKFLTLLILGILGSSISLGLVFYAFEYTSAIEGTIIYASAPIWITIGGLMFLKEKITKKELVAILITISGFLIIVIHPYFETQFSISANLFGNLLMLFAAFCWAAYSLLSKNVFNHSKKYSPALITFFTFFSGALTLSPFAMYEIFTVPMNLVQAIPGILYMSIFSSVVAYWLYEYGVQKIEVSEASIFQYIQPMFTIPVAFLVLNEKLTWWHLLGALITAIGIIISEQRKVRQ